MARCRRWFASRLMQAWGVGSTVWHPPVGGSANRPRFPTEVVVARLSKRVFLALSLLMFGAGCASDGSPLEPTAAPDAQTVSLDPLVLDVSLRLLSCTPQTYAKVVQTVGSAGGTLSVNGHSLQIPKGAVASRVTITMETPSDAIRSVRFSPEGLQFNPKARPTLRLSYARCTVPVGALLGIAYVSESFSLLERLSSTLDAGKQQVAAPIGHFSRYAINY